MTKLDTYNVGDTLNQVDLSQHIASMGIAIAHAQKELDTNSIDQLLVLAEPVPGLGGKSLLELELVPAFYHFERATLTASLSMSLELSEEIEADLSLDFNNSKQSETVTLFEKVKLRSVSKDLRINNDQNISFSGQSSDIQKIHSVSTQNTSSGSHFAIAERVALTDAAQDTQYTDQYVQTEHFSADHAGLIIVPPAGRQIGIWDIENDDPIAYTAAGDQFTTTQTTPIDAAVDLLTQARNAGFSGGILAADGIAVAPENDLGKVFFNTNSHALTETVNLENGTTAIYDWRIRALAEIALLVPLNVSTFVGHTDDVGSDDANQQLSQARANAVKNVFSARGISNGSPSGQGETLANNAGATDDDVRFRRVDIAFDNLAPDAMYLYLEGNDTNVVISVDPNAARKPDYTFTYATSSQTASTIVDGFSQTTNTAYNASAQGEFVFVTNSETSGKDIADLYVFARNDTEVSGDDSTSEELVKERSASTSKQKQKTKKVKKASAVAVSANARYARMFGMSMSGNMSISAELLSVSCPDPLLAHVKAITAGTD